MNGQLSEQPLAELIREISSRSLGGRLRLEHDRVHVVVYFENGNIGYAASNLRTLRLREYLRKANSFPWTTLTIACRISKVAKTVVREESAVCSCGGTGSDKAGR